MSDPRTSASERNNTASAQATEAVARALSVGLASTPDDGEHPEYEQLCAFAEDRADGADQEWIEGHLECCSRCREDVADISKIRAELAEPTIGDAHRRRPWLRTAVALLATAAGIALVVWLRDQPPTGATPVTAPAEVVAQSVLTPDESAAVARALETGSVTWPDNIGLLRGQAGTLLSGANAAETRWTPTMPVGSMVEDARPVFTWPPLEGATSYSVAVFDERFRQVASSGPLDDTTWTPAGDLPRGLMLAWQVTAHLNKEGVPAFDRQADVISPAPPAPEARFVVLTPAEVATLNEQRRRLANEPLALALVLTKFGLFDQAEAALRVALEDPRYDAARVRELLVSLNHRGQ